MEKDLINKLYEEIEIFLDEPIDCEQITRVMNVFAALRASDYREDAREDELLEKLYLIVPNLIDRKAYNLVQRCANLISMFKRKSAHEMIYYSEPSR